MSERIEIGDLVMVVRGHRCAVNIIGGIPYTVIALHLPINGGWTCPVCHARSIAPTEIGAQLTSEGVHGIPLSWLKKIPPLTEPETTERKEESPA